MRPVANPELPAIARALPADTAYQITRTAERLGFTDYSDVLAEVANVITRRGGHPKGILLEAAPKLANACFPHPPLAIQRSTGPTVGRLHWRSVRTRRPVTCWFSPEADQGCLPAFFT
jgi:hypothetical protein